MFSIPSDGKPTICRLQLAEKEDSPRLLEASRDMRIPVNAVPYEGFIYRTQSHSGCMETEAGKLAPDGADWE